MERVSVSEIMDTALLSEMLRNGYVKQTRHPSLPLSVLNYTSRTQFERNWNSVTETCRGLIVSDDGFVVARPLRKFFNLSEHASLPEGPISVTEKLDGSLGILYPTPEGLRVATRGSFTSSQSVDASMVWQERYGNVSLPDDLTFSVEIINPNNKIVIDYGHTDDLFLIAVTEKKTGRSLPLSEFSSIYPGPTVTHHEFQSLSDVASSVSRLNKEGYVVWFPQTDLRVKIKHDEYVRLHRLVTGVSARRIWEALSAGISIDSWLEDVPDELYGFVVKTRDDILSDFARVQSDLHALYKDTLESMPEGFSRADFAAAVKKSQHNPLARALFALYDKKDVSDFIWAAVRPEKHEPFFHGGHES